MSVYDFKDKVVLVTGGANPIGIGYATAYEFSKANAKVVAIVDIDPRVIESAQAISNETGGQVIPFNVDVTEEIDMQEVVEALVRVYGTVDCVANCAAVNIPGSALDITKEQFMKTYEVNVWSQLLITKLVVPIMKEQGSGTIVDVSSANARASEKSLVAYVGSKGAIESQNQANALDWASFGIRFNTVAPGLVNTGFNDAHHKFMGTTREEVTEQVGALQPIGRLIYPKEVANAILFFSSDLSSGCVGAFLTVDGGYLTQ